MAKDRVPKNVKVWSSTIEGGGGGGFVETTLLIVKYIHKGSIHYLVVRQKIRNKKPTLKHTGVM